MTNERTPLENDYARRVAVVQSAIDRADPLGLLRVGAPADEYAHEAAAIVAALSDGRRETIEVVWRVFQDAFGPDCGRREAFVNLAIDIETALLAAGPQHPMES